MGVFSDRLEREVRLEHMRPEDVAAAREGQPWVFVPFGSVEWHGYHNAVGLDALKAHEQLVGLAARAGGVVYPPVYFGAGGGHTGWPSSFMVDGGAMARIVADLLRGFERDGYRKAILLSGHYPNRSEYLDAAIDAFRTDGGTMEVLALVENQAPGVGGDHASKFETSYMMYLHPDTVDGERLQAEPRQDVGPADQARNWMGEEHRGHPCYGLVGIDPRAGASVEVGREGTDKLLEHLEAWLTGWPASASGAPVRGSGHHFAFYGDCCSGVPGGACEGSFARVNAPLRGLDPQPDFIVFLGDHIAGSPADAAALRRQWRHWLNAEMAWLDVDRTPLYHVTSNHDTFDSESERVWREVFPHIPRNGPSGQEGLSYWVRRGDLLLVAVNTSFSGLGGYGHVESRWLDETLASHADARYRIVAGHHPVFPVNGYGERPLWCIVQPPADAFWSVLVRHHVLAYLCSHVIAFDVQEHDGVLQVCSGGAGTNYGPGGFMGEGEYHHFVEAWVDQGGLRLQTIDPDGQVRERHAVPGGRPAADARRHGC